MSNIYKILGYICTMQGRKDIQPKMMYQVNINDLVSDDNFYRLLASTLDLSFLYKATAAYYGTEGQESIDPVVFFKICLVGYLNNVNSDRRLISFCSNCLDVRWYIKSMKLFCPKSAQPVNEDVSPNVCLISVFNNYFCFNLR